MGDIGVLPSGRPPAGPWAVGCRDQPLARTQPLQTRPRVRCSLISCPSLQGSGRRSPEEAGRLPVPSSWGRHRPGSQGGEGRATGSAAHGPRTRGCALNTRILHSTYAWAASAGESSRWRPLGVLVPPVWAPAGRQAHPKESTHEAPDLDLEPVSWDTRRGAKASALAQQVLSRCCSQKQGRVSACYRPVAPTPDPCPHCLSAPEPDPPSSHTPGPRCTGEGAGHAGGRPGSQSLCPDVTGPDAGP